MSGPDDHSDDDRIVSVVVKSTRLLGASQGRVMIEWTLDGLPSDQWVKAFMTAECTRRGSPAFVSGESGEPLVYPEGTIRWSVPSDDMRFAAAYVVECIVSANSSFIGTNNSITNHRKKGPGVAQLR
jgi:hypothetical protein